MFASCDKFIGDYEHHTNRAGVQFKKYSEIIMQNIIMLANRDHCSTIQLALKNINNNGQREIDVKIAKELVNYALKNSIEPAEIIRDALMDSGISYAKIMNEIIKPAFNNAQPLEIIVNYIIREIDNRSRVEYETSIVERDTNNTFSTSNVVPTAKSTNRIALAPLKKVMRTSLDERLKGIVKTNIKLIKEIFTTKIDDTQKKVEQDNHKSIKMMFAEIYKYPDAIKFIDADNTINTHLNEITDVLLLGCEDGM